MLVIRDAREVRSWSRAYRRAGLSVGFVPTLGGLHAGHAALFREGRRECERLVASIYLNPTQFDSARDLESYPARLEEDLETCRREGVDLVWLGRREDFLPEGFQTRVEVERLTRRLCGASRPGHFRGVATVVTQLFHVVEPHRAYFGLKDFQQARVIQRMVRDLLIDLDVRLVPTVREEDGLALSSRNRRLTAEERRRAPALFRALDAQRRRLLAGERRADLLEEALRDDLAREPRFRVDYAEVLDARTLEPFEGGVVAEGRDVLLAAAVHLGAVRLIDSLRVEG